jgi:hypothetical protein
MMEWKIIPPFLTSALDGMGGQLHVPAALSPLPTGDEVEWGPDPVWTLWTGKILPLQGTKPRSSSPLLVTLQIELSRFLIDCYTDHLYSGFEVLTEVVMRSYVVWSVADYAV